MKFSEVLSWKYIGSPIKCCVIANIKILITEEISSEESSQDEEESDDKKDCDDICACSYKSINLI